jgi:hypothetical protein
MLSLPSPGIARPVELRVRLIEHDFEPFFFLQS